MELFDFRCIPRTPVFFKNHIPTPIDAFKPYYRRFHVDPDGDPRFAMGTLAETVKELKENSVTRAMIYATCAEDNIQTFEAVKEYSDFFHGMATVHTSRGIEQAFSALEKAYDEYGFYGMGINPYLEDIPASDRCYYSLYALSEARGKFVHIHSSTHFNPSTAIDIGDPVHVDQIARDFPKLKIIVGHGGRGFGLMGGQVADKHENVYIDFTAMLPQYIEPELIQMANTLLRKKIIYGSSNPTLPWDIWKVWLKFISEKNQPLFFHDNAMGLLGLKQEKKKEWNEK